MFRAYHVPEPARFAMMTFAEALQEKGIGAKVNLLASPDFDALASSYTVENRVAEHVSPPLSEEAKVTLKVSQNVHANMMPFVIGAAFGQPGERADRAGLGLIRKWYQEAGLDLDAVVQNDGAGGSAMFTPDFVVRFLTYMSRQSFFPEYLKALPVLGKDETQPALRMAVDGHVFAKGGSQAQLDILNSRMFMSAKGLVGYIMAPNGRKLTFTVYLGNIPITSAGDMNKPDQALGEIVSAAYDLLVQQ